MVVLPVRLRPGGLVAAELLAAAGQHAAPRQPGPAALRRLLERFGAHDAGPGSPATHAVSGAEREPGARDGEERAVRQEPRVRAAVQPGVQSPGRLPGTVWGASSDGLVEGVAAAAAGHDRPRLAECRRGPSG